MRVALIISEKSPTWASSRTIRSNLLGAYRIAFPGAELVTYLEDEAQIDLCVKSLNAKPYDKIIFLESVPNPITIISRLHLNKIRNSNCEIHFHIYGDFTLATPEWRSVFEALKGCRVRVLLASDSQLGLVSEFFERKSRRNLEICPFPVDGDFFSFRNNAMALRQQNAIEPCDVVAVYSGRVSVQKGFPLLIYWLTRFYQETGQNNLKLLIAGQFDDLGTIFWGSSHPNGTSYYAYQQAIQMVPDSLRNNILYLGHQTSSQLRDLYALSDFYLSLSTYHDEDYGMAPLEALSCGTRALLSGWGGFNSFPIHRGDVEICHVKIGPKGISMNYFEFKKKLLKLCQNSNADRDRRSERSDRYYKNFSIEGVGKLLIKQNKTKAKLMASVSPLFSKHASKILSMRTGAPPYTEPSSLDRLYFRLYRHYTATNL